MATPAPPRCSFVVITPWLQTWHFDFSPATPTWTTLRKTHLLRYFHRYRTSTTGKRSPVDLFHPGPRRG